MSVSEVDLMSVPTANRWTAYWELTKPRISAMVLVSIVVSGLISSEFLPSIWSLVNVAIGMFLVAASGNAMNMYFERYTDYLMPRTARRPLPDRRLSARDVMNFGAITFGSGITWLLTTLNWQTALCAALTWLLYVFVYTPLKTRTWLNTEVGAVAGALPILTGALATTETVTWNASAFFLVLLFWQFPHFMAIAWLYRDEYRRGGLQMLSVVDATGFRAGRKAIVTCVLTWLASLLPLVAMDGVWPALGFALLATIAAWYYWQASWRFYAVRNEANSRRLLRVSVLYLPAYMLLLVIFHQLA